MIIAIFSLYNNPMTFSDRRFALFVGAMMLAAAALPHLWARTAAGDAHVFGGLLFNPIDGNTYLAKAYQGYEGDWRFRLPYTAEPGDGAYINLYYLFIGHVARWTGLSIPLTYNLARLAGAGLMLAALWSFYRAVLKEPAKYRRAFAISALTLGMGWLLVPAGLIPMDLWVAEAYPLLAALTNSHFPLALALIVVLANPESGLHGRLRIARDALLALLLALVSPFGVLIALLPWAWESLRTTLDRLPDRPVSLGEFLHRPETARILAILAGGAPVLLYDLAAIRTDPVLARWDAQNVTALPPWWDVALSLSPALVLALAGFRKSPQILRGWFVLGLLMALIPIGLQRRFLMGLYIPLAGIAAVGFGSLRRSGVRLFFLACFVPAPVILLLSARAGIESHNPLLYLGDGEHAAMAWIETHTSPDDLVLAAPETGLFIPAYTGRRVIYGHPFETIAANAEREAVVFFYSQASSEAARQFLADRGIDFVFYGPREADLGAPPDLPSLQLVHTVAGVRIYAVEP